MHTVRSRRTGTGTVDRQPQLSEQLIHHSDRGSQYMSIRYTERPAETGIEPLMG